LEAVANKHWQDLLPLLEACAASRSRSPEGKQQLACEKKRKEKKRKEKKRKEKKRKEKKRKDYAFWR